MQRNGNGLAGRGVLVTGGGSSVGRAIAEQFAAAGAHVHVGDRSPEFIARLRDEVPDVGASVCDVGERQAVGALFQEAQQSVGTVDFLVNCVGVAGPHALIEDIDPAEWRSTIETNFNAVFETMRLAIPGMKQRRFGAIVNFSTASTKTGIPYRAPYVASKAGLEALTYAAARELGPAGVRCNAIRPGAIDNGRFKDIVARNARTRGVSEQEMEERLLRYVSMRRKVQPDELAEVALFLCTDSGRSITGQFIEVSGNLEWEE